MKIYAQFSDISSSVYHTYVLKNKTGKLIWCDGRLSSRTKEYPLLGFSTESISEIKYSKFRYTLALKYPWIIPYYIASKIFLWLASAVGTAVMSYILVLKFPLVLMLLIPIVTVVVLGIIIRCSL